MDKRITVQVSPLFFGLLAWLMLFEEQRVAAGCLAASLIHECGHLLVLFMKKAPPRSIVVGIFGMRIERDTACLLSFTDDLLIAAGGPAINLLCCLIFCFFQKAEAAAIHLLIAVLNLLPVEALDGGQMLLAYLYRRLPRERAERVMLICSLLIVFPLGVIGFYLLFQSGCNFSLLCVDAYLIFLLIMKRK